MVILLLLRRTGSGDDKPAVGFPIVLLVLTVLATVVAACGARPSGKRTDH